MKLFDKAIFEALKNSYGKFFRKEELESFPRVKKYLFGERLIIKRVPDYLPKANIKSISFQHDFENVGAQTISFLNPFFA